MARLASLFLPLLLFSCAPAAEGPVLVLGFVPSQQAETLADDVEPLERYLEDALQASHPGLRVESFVAVKYVGLVAALKAQKVDIAFLAPFSYLLSHRDTLAAGGPPTTPLLRTVRFGGTTYRSQILARRDLGITEVAGLRDTTFAFTDPASTSGFLYPRITLQAAGIDYRTDLANYAMLGSHDNVVAAIYRGDFEAGGTFEDARYRLVYEHPDIAPGMRLRLAYLPTGETLSREADLRHLAGGDPGEEWCPGEVAAALVGEVNFWTIQMRLQPPSLERLAESLRPLAATLSTTEATLLDTPCGTVYAQVLERWEGEVAQVAVTAPIPNDIIAARPGLDPALSQAITEALLALEESAPDTFQILKDLYTIEGFVPTTHNDFLELESLAKESGML